MATRLATACTALLFCVSFASNADESPAEPVTPPKSVEAAPAADKEAEFKPPPGFRTRKRGDTVVYCRKETTLGSRFSAEKCYDEDGLRELRVQEIENKEKIERMRACKRGPCIIG